MGSILVDHKENSSMNKVIQAPNRAAATARGWAFQFSGGTSAGLRGPGPFGWRLVPPEKPFKALFQPAMIRHKAQ